jgi:acyl-CoA synthetase (NDP forming)
VLPNLAPVPSFPFPESAAVALAAVTRYGEWLKRPADRGTPLDAASLAKVRALVDVALEHGGGWLPPAECNEILMVAGIAALPMRTARTADEAVVAAQAVGYPVALKASGSGIVHKSEEGAVRLSLTSDADVRNTYAAFEARLGPRLTGVVVQPMAGAGAEMVIGGVTDPAFGPIVMAGSGGVLVELMADTAFATCPLSEAGAKDLLERVRGVVRLRGFRGAPVLDETAFRRLLVRVSQLLAACPEIHELDLNPVMVTASGATAVDARIKLGPESPPPAGRRIRY